MMVSFFQLKNYLYKKNIVKFIVPVLAVFLCTSCLSSVVKKKGFSTEIKDKVAYDMPPMAPIPPEKYCFEEKEVGSAVTKAELYIAGDSVYGKIDYAKTANISSGELRGFIYGSTLIITYQFKADSGVTRQEQKWRLFNDSLYRIDLSSTADTANAGKESALQPHFAGIMRKVPCR